MGKWGDGSSVVIAAHGLTENHLSFAALADQLDHVMLLAPDLRGRGRSRDVGPPYGLSVHADDLVAVLDYAGVEKATVIGHSFGGFVAVVTADRHADRVSDLVLIDGGLPMELFHRKTSLPEAEEARAVAGPAVERLDMSFASRDAYLDFWRSHPAFVSDWNEYAEQMFIYDLTGTAPELRPAVVKGALSEASELRSGAIERAISGLSCPVTFLHAPRGLFNEKPPLYPEIGLGAAGQVPAGLTDVLVPSVNHYTIVLSDRGAKAVARAVSSAKATNVRRDER